MYLVFVYKNFIGHLTMSHSTKKLIMSILTELMGTLEFLIGSGEFTIIVLEFNYEFSFKAY